jgi:RNA polymerase sigma-70 factor (ECF subfamily)
MGSTPKAVCAGTAVERDVAWQADLESHRAYLLRFARGRLRDAWLAEDLVHEVFVAILSSRAPFASRSTLRTWMVGILRHKIADVQRSWRRMEQPVDLTAAGDGDSAAHASPAAGPDALAEQRERLALALRAIDALPDGLRRAMRLRVLHDRPSQSVCEALAISAGTLSVRLHRARERVGRALAN